MARNAEFEKSLKQFNANLYHRINKYMIDYGVKKSKQLCDTFVDVAKRTLDDATPAPESKHFIEEIKSRIKIKKRFRKSSRKGKKINQHLVAYTINIPVDSQGLVMFLEYGTGLEGLRDQHEETKTKTSFGKTFKPKVNWEYAVNKDKQRVVTLRNKFNQTYQDTQPCYITRNGKRGFVFKKKKNSYIDIKDVEFHNVLEAKASWVKGYIDKNGRVVKPYARYHKDTRYYTGKNTYVLSSGLKPVRFIYKAKREVKRLIHYNLI